MKSLWQSIDGHFDFQDVYQKVVAGAKDGDIFVEVGSYKGKSLCYLIGLILESGKKITVHAVDSFIGIKEPGAEPDIETQLRANIAAMGGDGFCTVHKSDSAAAAGLFPDASLEFVFIDAGHSYEDVKKDIAAWRPKMKPGRLFAGHDYNQHNFPGVVQAVNEAFGGRHTRWGNVSWVYLTDVIGTVPGISTCLCVSLPSRPDRRDALTALQRDQGWQLPSIVYVDGIVAPAPDGWEYAAGSYGASLAHHKAMAAAKSYPEWVLILEDDATWTQNTWGLLRGFMDNVPSDAEGIMFGYAEQPMAKLPTRARNVVRIAHAFCLHAYALRGRALDIAIASSEHPKAPTDYIVKEIMDRHCVFYGPIHSLFGQSAGFSDVEMQPRESRKWVAE